MRKSIKWLVLLIIILSFTASSYGIFSSQGQGQTTFKSIYGENVTLYGKGLYQHDSLSAAVQAIGQDYITLFMGIPLLIISLILAQRGLIKGKLLLTGTLGYFLYTYTSYSFLSMYNSLFLIDVSLMSASFFAFILCIMSFDIPQFDTFFTDKLPVKFIGGLLLITSFLFGLMWLGRIIPSISSIEPPFGLEHYTTLVIQALDLGFLVPTGILSGILLIRKKPFGYLLSSILIFKDLTMLSALTAMVILQISAGVDVGISMLFVVIPLNLLFIFSMVLILKNIKESTSLSNTGRSYE